MKTDNTWRNILFVFSEQSALSLNAGKNVANK